MSDNSKPLVYKRNRMWNIRKLLDGRVGIFSSTYCSLWWRDRDIFPYVLGLAVLYLANILISFNSSIYDSILFSEGRIYTPHKKGFASFSVLVCETKTLFC